MSLEKVFKGLKKLSSIGNDCQNRILLLLYGDLFQLPPVRSNYIVEAPYTTQKRNRAWYDGAGFEKWHSIKQIITLDQNMRQKMMQYILQSSLDYEMEMGLNKT